MEKRKHHYIPLFYLENFTCISDDSIQTPYVWVLERGKKEPYRRAPVNAASETGFYDVEGLDGKLSSVVEDLLSSLESICSKVLKKVLNRQPLTAEERDAFALFVSSMRLRVPHFKISFGQFIKEVAERMIKMSALQPDYLEKFLLERERRTGEKVEIDVDEWRRSMLADDSPYDIEVNQGFLMRVMLDSIIDMELRKIVSEMNWKFLTTQQDEHFVTSDNPVVVVDPERKDQGAGYKSSPTVQLTFPLSAKMCLLATWSEGKDEYKEIGEEMLEEINIRTSGYCTKYVFSPSEKINLPPE